MSHKTLSLAAMAAMVAASMVPAAAEAQYRGDRDGYYQQVRHYRGNDGYYGRGDYRDRAYADGYYRDRGYYDQGYGRRGYRDGRRYRDYGRCRDKGTGGTIIGAIAGGLLGNAAVGRHGDNTAGTIVGAGVGALAGRAIDRNC